MTRFGYVKALAFWVDVTSEGKRVSKLFQKSGVLLSDVTSGVEDGIDSITALAKSPGPFMKGFMQDFDAANETLYGTDLSGVADGEQAYTTMLSNTTTSIGEHMSERFSAIIKDPVLKAACVFEHSRWPSLVTDKEGLEQHGEADIDLLLKHFSTLFSYLGGDASKVQRQWRRLKMYVSKPENKLFGLPYQELYTRLFDHRSDKNDDQHYYHVLLLVVIVMCIAVDTSVCERGFSLMNNLKTARRSRMGDGLLRILMTICSLGTEWEDPTRIPVAAIVEEWRSQTNRGRYEAAMWRAAGLEEAAGRRCEGSSESNGNNGCRGSSGVGGSSGGSSSDAGGSASGVGRFTEEDCHMADVDATQESGFFARWGEPAPQRLGELAGTHLRNGVPVP